MHGRTALIMADRSYQRNHPNSNRSINTSRGISSRVATGYRTLSQQETQNDPRRQSSSEGLMHSYLSEQETCSNPARAIICSGISQHCGRHNANDCHDYENHVYDLYCDRHDESAVTSLSRIIWIQNHSHHHHRLHRIHRHDPGLENLIATEILT